MADEEDLNLRPLKPKGQNLRWTKSARVLAGYGAACILLGLGEGTVSLCALYLSGGHLSGVVACGVASLWYGPELVSKHDFRMEWKWSNLMLFVAGGGALFVTGRESLTAIAVVLVASLLQAAMGLGTAVVHVANAAFRAKDEEFLREQRQDYQPARNVGTVNVFLTVIGNRPHLPPLSSLALTRDPLEASCRRASAPCSTATASTLPARTSASTSM